MIHNPPASLNGDAQIPNGIYTIVNRNENLHLNCSADGAPYLQQCIKTDFPPGECLWDFVIEERHMKIIHRATQKALRIENSSKSEEAFLVGEDSKAGYWSQQFYFSHQPIDQDSSTCWFQIINRNSGLSLRALSKTSGSRLVQSKVKPEWWSSQFQLNRICCFHTNSPHLIPSVNYKKLDLLPCSSSQQKRNYILHGTGMKEPQLINKGTDGSGYTVDVNGEGAQPPKFVSTFKRSGHQSVLCHIQRKGWGWRSEIIPNGNGHRRYWQAEFNKEYWYGWSMYLPKDHIVDNHGEIYAQHHNERDEDLGEDWRNPSWALGPDAPSNPSVLKVFLRWDDKRITPPAGTPNRYRGEYCWEICPVTEVVGRWTDFVANFCWSWQEDGPGFFHFWMNGKLKVSHIGPNCYNDRRGTYFKLGIYKWPWNLDWKNSDTLATERSVYIDELYIASCRALYQDVCPRD